MTPTARLQRIGERVNALSLRERALVLLVVFALVFLAWDMMVMQPINQRQAQVQGELEQVRERVAMLNTGIQQVAARRGTGGDAELRRRIEELETEIHVLEDDIRDLHGGITAPGESIHVLAGLLAERSDITITELHNLPVKPLTGMDGREISGIYVHRVRVLLESDFAGVGDYLASIVELPEGVFWESMRLDVPEWPTNRVELVLYGLAFDDTWLEL